MPQSGGKRDTVKDIILGSEPSGKAPRPVQLHNLQTASLQNTQAYNNLHNNIDQLRKEQSEIFSQSEYARRQLEPSQYSIEAQRHSARDIDQLWRNISSYENQIGSLRQENTLLRQDLITIKALLERQSNELAQVNSELRNRQQHEKKSTVDVNALEMQIHDLRTQLIQQKRMMESEITERMKTSHMQTDLLNRLQAHVRQQEATKTDILANISKRSDLEKERMADDLKRLNEKIAHVSMEMAKNINEREKQLREGQRNAALQAAIKAQLDARQEYEIELNRRNEDRWKNQSRLIEDLKEIVQQDKVKYRDRFQKVNAALLTIEKHMELGNEKIDKIMNAEIQSRKLHEKGLLSKVDQVEVQLNNYLDSLTRTIEDVKTGVSNIKIPILDTDALQQDMEALATDKSKLSMEGLLKLEQRITQMQHKLYHKLGSELERDLNNKLRHQVHKLDDIMDEVENAQNKIRDKVERQVPKDLHELSAKVDNLKTQLTSRIDQEEEERYLAIKELQEVYGRIASGGTREVGGGSNVFSTNSAKRDTEECKVAIKKLAESVTTVKNVLDKKLHEEIRRREQDVEVLSSRLDALTIQGLQQQQKR